MSELTPLGSMLGKHTTEQNFSFREYQMQMAEFYNNTVGDLNTIDGFDCKVCKNKGFIAKVDDHDSIVYALCHCKKTRATLKRAKESGLNDILTEYTFDKYVASDEWQKHVKTTAQTFCKDEDAHWFYIGGQVGSGKTHICTAISAHYIKSGKEVKYMLWSEESKKLKSLVNDIGYQDEIAIYKNADVLYIDDFLKVRNGETPTNGDINLAFEIINHRLLSKDKITIISSEKTLDELLDYDEATMSRISTKSGHYKLNISKDRSKNYRLRDANG